MHYLTFVAENGDEVNFDFADIKSFDLYGEGDDYENELEYMEGTIAQSGDDDHYEFGEFGLPVSSLRWLTVHANDIAQVIVDDEPEHTYYVPEGMSLSHMVVNGDLSFVIE